MSTEATDVAVSQTEEAARFQRRLERERRARREAEAVAEQGLRDLYAVNQDLDRRVQERVAEVEKLAVKAALAERVKDEILASVSHELRTPLMAVIGALDLLAGDGGDREAYLKVATDGASRLRDLVDELFAVVDISSGGAEAQRSTVSIRSFVDSLSEGWRLPALKAGVLLVTAIETDQVEMAIDVERTRAALDRLLSNAIRHGGAGTVTMSVETGDEHVRFSVVDRGPGIPVDRLEALLEPFRTADMSSTRSKGGMGLGLSVVRGLVELQNGTLAIDSEVGVGTTVTITVPTDPQP